MTDTLAFHANLIKFAIGTAPRTLTVRTAKNLISNAPCNSKPITILKIWYPQYLDKPQNNKFD
jgi:hypothetical protein